jgi:type II secretory pathway pseudopilin PulG
MEITKVVVLALVVVTILGSVAVSLMQQTTDARSRVAEERNKGQQGEIATDGKRQGHGGGGGEQCMICHTDRCHTDHEHKRRSMPQNSFKRNVVVL